MIFLAVLAACRSPHTDADSDVATVPDSGTTTAGTTTTGTTIPSGTGEDVDQDGYATSTDCNDYDPRVHPGATETWNDVDDDCDGRIDADGTYAGTMSVAADAIVDGQAVHTTVDCAATLLRARTHLEFTVTCSPDANDATGRLLLGDTATIVQQENVVQDASWSGSTLVSSTDGWTAPGTGSASWPDFSSVHLGIALSSFSLSLYGADALELQP